METKIYKLETESGPVDLSVSERVSGDSLLLFIHGLGCSKDSFEDVWAQRDFDNYSLLIPDLVGYGDCSRPEHFPYTIESQASVLALLLERYSYSKLYLVGHSLGGAVSLKLIEQLAGMKVSFFNVEGNLIGADCEFASRQIAKRDLETFEKDLFPRLQSKFDALSKKYVYFEKTNARVLHLSSKSLVDHSDSGKLLEQFKKLQIPKTYVYGDENKEHATVSAVGGIEKIEISNSGHFPMNDNPTEFYAALKRFLDD